MNTRRTLLATAALTLVGLTALPAAHAQDKGAIGIAMPTKSSARWIADGDNMVKVLKDKATSLICNTLTTTSPTSSRRSRT